MPWVSSFAFSLAPSSFLLSLLTSCLTFLTCWLLWRRRGSARGATSSTASYETRLERCESALKTIRLEWEEFYGRAERIIGRANKLAALYGGHNGREIQTADSPSLPSNPGATAAGSHPEAPVGPVPASGVDRHALLAAANRGGASAYLARQRREVTNAERP